MAATDSLHALIHSLSKSEKRYFKLFAGKSSSRQTARYLQLFDQLAGMAHYDPEVLQAAMQWPNFKSGYTMAKRYLHDKILESLAAFQKSHDQNPNLATLLSHIRILRNKNLLRQAIRKIAHAKRLAYKVQDLHRLLEILLEERWMIIHSPQSILKKSDLAAVNEEIGRVIAGINLDFKLQNMHHQFFGMIHAQGGSQDQETMAKIEAFVRELQELDAPSQPFFMPKINHYAILNQYHYLKGNFEASQEAASEEVTHFQTHPYQIKILPSKYVAALHNYANRSIMTHDHSTILACIHALRDFRTTKAKAETLRMESYLSMGMAMVVNSGQIPENKGFIATVTTAVRQPQPVFSRRYLLNLKWILASCEMIEGNFKAALPWVREIMEDPTHTLLRHYDRLLRIAEMVIHYELGNYDWLEYRIRSGMEGSAGGHVFAFEKLFFQSLRELIRAKGKQEVREVAASFVTDLRALSHRPQETAVFTFFDFETWAEAKALGITFAELTRQNWAAMENLEVRLGS